MKKLHMYAGLLSFAAMSVWGVAGLHGTFSAAPGERTPPEPEVRWVEYQPPADIDDQQMLDRVIEHVSLPFLRPGRQPRRDDDNRLFVNFFTANGRRRVTLFEKDDRIRIEAWPTTLVAYINFMHILTWQHSAPAVPVKLWGAYNEFSLWAFLFMTASGVYLWLATRPKLIWPFVTLGGGAAAFLMFWVAGG